jgi:hypothetical protein
VSNRLHEQARARRHGYRPNSAVQEVLQHTYCDLEDLRRVWTMAVEQLQLSARIPPRVDAELTDELGYPMRFGYGATYADSKFAAHDALVRQERAERVVNARHGRPTLGYSPAPLRVGALEDLVTVEVMLLDVADQVTRHVRRNTTDERPGPHRLLRKPTHHTVKHNDVDDLGYALRLGYGRKHVISGRQLDHVGARRDVDPTTASISWLLRALPAVTDVPLAEKVASSVSTVRLIARGVVGLPDLQVRLSQACFVCGQPALRMNLDKRYVECRNPDCQPPAEQCGFTGPRGEPRWYQGEWHWLSQILGVSLGDQLLQMLEQVAS